MPPAPAVRKDLLLGLLIASAMCAGRLAAEDASATPAPPANSLTEQEIHDGWKLLWDGKTTDGWHAVKSDKFPAKGWTIQNGELTLRKGGSKGGGDIMTAAAFSEFELVADYKTDAKDMDSGVKYFVHLVTGGEEHKILAAIGYEYQIHNVTLDEAAAFIKAGEGRSLPGGLYGTLQPALTRGSNPVGQWNTIRIVARGNHVEHWLNGDKVLEFDRDSKAFLDAMAAGKFAGVPGYADWKNGFILLQDHGSEVSFRNIKIRPLGKTVDPAGVKPLDGGKAPAPAED